MLITALLFLLSAGIIYLACEYFVNGIEWLGQKLNFGATATGTVLAAFGTALPESAVTFVAVMLGRTPEIRDIGVGAALGGPLVLATIAYAVVGVALWFNRRRLGRHDNRVRVDHARLARDQSWFLSIFVVKCGLGLIAFAFKPWLGVLFLVAYALYVWRELRGEDSAEHDEALEPLKFQPRSAVPSLVMVIIQTSVSLWVIAYASHIFVSQIETIGVASHMPPHLIALVLSPVATELPETMNALIWVRQGKERLALANISGAMMIQATIPSALALFATPWMFDAPLIVAGVLTAVAIIYLGWLFRRGDVDGRKLVPVALLYAVFAAFVAWYIR
ncbi:sodium:calcium antiporter [Dyella caseinilytica]|uniref:Sodium:calcium antiporter n=1 Tax=Dyella caseinilytica TaxID=1849581 RepID=A0ABX7GZM9_9GAMM|nr:sodium:calcium antiporter [Dyella caseinilytica]QRN55411.1 sodium:calcium antiporter [Dyella caseinilytica]GGA01497.1 membrane protein [Dyella caseinilytica]